MLEEAEPLLVASALSVGADGTTKHGVFAHQDGGLATKGSTDVHELPGADVVGMNEETLGVGVQKLTELGIPLQNRNNMEDDEVRRVIEEQ